LKGCPVEFIKKMEKNRGRPRVRKNKRHVASTGGGGSMEPTEVPGQSFKQKEKSYHAGGERVAAQGGPGGGVIIIGTPPETERKKEQSVKHEDWIGLKNTRRRSVKLPGPYRRIRGLRPLPQYNTT